MPEHRYAQSLEEMANFDDILSMSGLEFMQAIIDGDLPGAPIGKTMGFLPTHAEHGSVTFEGAPEFGVLNPIRTVHGGWYGTVLDSCMACAVQSTLAVGQIYTTLEYKINILRSIPVGMKVRAVGKVQHVGRSTGIANGEIRGIEDGKLYATGSTTCIVMAGPKR
ncbi:PaaI family thioesterase [Shimia sp. R9_2]|uniref:PaaI family thioesterase n=1 Tax=Shimia sp. R9_2 TaxID=2821112 RepID=UPI001ADAB685|nr:PaaI family thioesterase [Shimia sp. R9_2]MBO9397383.1 PaaI family thioesterase [Shimia sp. R9_2]